MKLGRTFEGVRHAIDRAGVTDRALYVERASAPEERVERLRDVEGRVPYMSLVLVPTASRSARREGDQGRVTVVGLGPGGPEWLTPEAQAELAAAEELVGYETYLARVPARHGQRRHASDNRVEAERARHALELAAAGARVAVVSSGDPGIFAMASGRARGVRARQRPALRRRAAASSPGCRRCRRPRRESERRSVTTSA